MAVGGGEGQVGLFVKGAFADADGGGEFAGDLLGQIHCALRQLGAGHGAVDQAEVAGAAGGGGDAVDLGDDRLGQGGQRLHQRAAAGEEVEEIGGALIRRVARGLHFLEVMPGAEGFARPGEHHRFDTLIRRDGRQFRLQRRQHVFRQGVEGARVVEGQAGDGGNVLADQDVFGHVFLHNLVQNGRETGGKPCKNPGNGR